MPSLTIRNIPKSVLNDIKRKAKEDQRSMNSYLLILLEHHTKEAKK